MERMYRIFISSTYCDLKRERSSIQKAILEMGHYPICMETFVSTDSHQMDFIIEQLNTADVYIIILGNRYGTMAENDTRSYTEREYIYAKEIGLPVFAFLNNKIDEKIIDNPVKFKEFYNKLKNENHLTLWNSSSDLIQSVVSTLNYNFKNNYGGWIRETISQKSLRTKIARDLDSIQYELNSIINGKSVDNRDCLIDIDNKISNILEDIKRVGATKQYAVIYKRIDLLYSKIKSVTINCKLNPLPIFKYAKFLFAFYNLQKSICIAESYKNQCKDDSEKRKANTFIGMVYWKDKNFEKAKASLETALNSYKKYYKAKNVDSLIKNITNFQLTNDHMQDIIVLGELFNDLGLIADNLKKYDNAIKYYQYAVNLIKHIYDLNKIDPISYKYQLYLYNLTSVQFKKNIQNIDNIKKVIDILNTLPDSLNKTRRLARSYQLYADMKKLSIFGDYQSLYAISLDYYKDAIYYQQKNIRTNFVDYKSNIAWCLHKMAEIYDGLKQITNAIKYYKLSIQFKEELVEYRAENTDNISSLALSYWKLSDLLFRKFKDSDNLPYIYNACIYGENAFLNYELLYDKHPVTYRKDYIDVAKLNIRICGYLENLTMKEYYKNKLSSLKAA